MTLKAAISAGSIGPTGPAGATGPTGPVFTGGALSTPVRFADGASAAPSAYFGASNYGFFLDTVNDGIGWGFNGLQTGWMTHNAIHMEPATVALTEFALVGSAGVRFAGIRFSNDQVGSILAAGKGRGSTSAKAVPILGDTLGNINFGGYDTISTTNGFQISTVLVETGTVGNAAMGGRLIFKPTPIGSGTPTQAGTFDYANGLQLSLPPADGISIVNGLATAQGATTTSPGWYAQITGDAFPRVRVGLNATDIASISLGSGAGVRDTFIERANAATVRFGAPDAAAPTIQFTSVQSVLDGTLNTAGVIWNFVDSAGTGTGQSGGFRWRLHPAGSSGTTQNPFATGMTLQNHAANTPGLFLSSALFTGGSATSTVPNFTIQQPSGATPVTSWNTNGSYFGINAVSGFSGNFLDFHINGSTSAFKIDSAGSVYVGGASFFLRTLAALTNNSASNTATMTNAPVSGNPTKWVAVDDNGTTRYMPLW